MREKLRLDQGAWAWNLLSKLSWTFWLHLLVLGKIWFGEAAVDSTVADAPAIPDCGLPDRVPKDQLQHVSNAGVHMPLGVVKVGWASAEIEGYMLLIIAEEVLGLHAHFSVRQSASLGIIATLRNPTDHIGVEAWTSAYQAQVDVFIEDAESNAPTAVGKMDFVGYEGTYGRKRTFDAAVAAEPDLFLEFYKCYNRSTFDTYKYFAALSDIPTSRMTRCSESRLSDPSEANLLGEHTGDWDGTELINGSINVTKYSEPGVIQRTFKCMGGVTGYWWLAPACRHDANTCIPWLTGASYGLPFCVQQAVAYNMPIACGNSPWGEYTQLPLEYATLFYWWVPDATFVGVGTKITFPPNDKGEWAISKKVTSSADIDLDTWVNANMSKISSKMMYVATKMTLTGPQIEDLLKASSSENSELSPGQQLTKQEAACLWMKQNEVVWRNWIQDLTVCESGQGLINDEGIFVDDRSKASACSYCTPGTKSVEFFDAKGTTHKCMSCEPGYAQISVGQTECPQCEGGKYASTSGAQICEDCVAGTFAKTAQAHCTNCSGGTYASDSGTSECATCLQGSYQSEEMQTACRYCEKGTYSDAVKLTLCKSCGNNGYTTEAIASTTITACMCDVGFYLSQNVCNACPEGSTTLQTASSSMSSCLCSQGSYMEEGNCFTCPNQSTTIGNGQTSREACQCELGLYMSKDFTSCLLCPQGSTTSSNGKTSVRSCHCYKGEYMPKSFESGCRECPKGMTCPTGSNEANAEFLTLPNPNEDQRFLELSSRYWSSIDDPMSVFECRSGAKCPGNVPPGPRACAQYLEGQSCEHCKDDYYWNGAECLECGGVEATSFLYPVLPLLLLPILILIMYRVSRDTFHKWGSYRNGLAVTAFITLSHYQVITIISSASISLPDSVQDAYQVFHFTNDMSSVFNVKCASMGDFKVSMISKGLVPLFVVLFAVVVWCVARLIGTLTNNAVFSLNPNIFASVVGSLMFTFFSGIAALALNLFKCSNNPNGKATLLVDFSITCYDSDDWKDMLAVGIVFVFLYIICLGGWFTRAVIIAPKYFANQGFQMRYKFLVMKFHNEAYWWGLVILAKMFFINVAMCVATDGVAQLYLVMSVVLIYTSACFVIMPYRHRIANALEVISSIGVIYACSLLQAFCETSQDHLDIIEITAAVVSFSPILFGGFVCIWLMAVGNRYPYSDTDRANARQKFESLHAAAKSIIRVVDNSRDLGVDMILHLAEWDRYYLKMATAVINHEIIGNDSSKRIVDKQLSNQIRGSADIDSQYTAKGGDGQAKEV